MGVQSRSYEDRRLRMATAGPRDDGVSPHGKQPPSPGTTSAKAYDRLGNLSEDVARYVGRSLSHGRPLRNWRGTAVRLGNERCHTPKTPPLPWGEGGGEGVRTIGVAMSRLIESAHPLTLVPLPMGEGTGCDLNVLFSSALPRDGAVMLLSQRCSNRGVAKAVVPESPSLPAQKSRGHERASAHASWAPSPEDRAPAPNQPAVV
jgi:hypothetical protein